MKKSLENQLWQIIVKNMPIPAKDLLLYSQEKGLLMGKRNNKPARNFYFVPGGRVYKNESNIDAIKRISKEELNFCLNSMKFKSIGLYDHFYSESIWEESDISTHYIVEAILIKIEDSKKVFNICNQHSELKWINQLNMNKENVHPYSKQYLLDILKIFGK